MSKEMEKELEKDQVTPETEEAAQETAEAEEAEAPAAEAAAPTQEEEDMKTKYLRLAADFQNFKRRTEKEKSDIYAYANEKFALDLLDVIDNFERALIHQDDCKDEKMKEGMELIFKK